MVDLNPGSRPFTAQFRPERYFFTHPMEPPKGADTVGRAGEAMGRTANELADMIGQDDARDVSVKAAQIHAHYVDQIDQATLSGNGDALAQIKDNYSADLQQLQDNAKTRQGYGVAQSQATELTSRLGQRLFVAGANIAGAKLNDQVNTMRNVQGGLVGKDPFNDGLYTQAQQQITGMVNSATDVPAAGRQKVLTASLNQLAGTRAIAQANLDPSKYIKQPYSDKYLTEQSSADAVKTAQFQQHARVEQGLLSLSLQERTQEVNNQAALKAWVPKIIDGSADLTTVGKDPNLTGQGMENVMEFAHRFSTEGTVAIKSDPATYLGYEQRLSLPEGAPGALNADSFKSAVQGDLAKHKISLPDANHLQELADKWQDSNPNYKALSKMTAIAVKQFQMTDILNAPADAYQFSLDAQSALKKAESAGTDPTTTLFNPKSPEYLLAPQNLARYASAPSPAAAATGTRSTPLPHIVDGPSYEALAAGTRYVGPDGLEHIKGGK